MSNNERVLTRETPVVHPRISPPSAVFLVLSLSHSPSNSSSTSTSYLSLSGKTDRRRAFEHPDDEEDTSIEARDDVELVTVSRCTETFIHVARTHCATRHHQTHDNAARYPSVRENKDRRHAPTVVHIHTCVLSESGGRGRSIFNLKFVYSVVVRTR